MARGLVGFPFLFLGVCFKASAWSLAYSGILSRALAFVFISVWRFDRKVTGT